MHKIENLGKFQIELVKNLIKGHFEVKKVTNVKIALICDMNGRTKEYLKILL